MKGKFALLFALSLLSPFLSGQSREERFSISGYIEDQESGEKLVGVNIYDAVSQKGTVTNAYGFFSLTLPVDSVQLSFSFVGYETLLSAFYHDRDREVNLAMDPAVTLEAVEVTAEAAERIEQNTQMSTVSIPVRQIKKLPAFLGETDVLKTLQLLPGVQSGSEGQSGLYVRGGSPDQNLILLDGVPVYNASHLFGFFSVFNTDAVKDVNLIKGGFPARYGGRLSSVLEIGMKEGNNREWGGAGSVSTIATRLTVEGPIQPGKTSLLLSGRRTYLDLLAKPFVQAAFAADDMSGDVGYFFHDYNAKLNHEFSRKDKLYVSAYAGRDKFYFRVRENFEDESYETKAGLGWGNITTAVRWNHLWNSKLFSNLTLTYSDYDFNTLAEAEDEYNDGGAVERSFYSLQYQSGVRDFAARMDFDYVPHPDHFIRFGVSGIQHRFNPGNFDTRIEESDFQVDIDTIFGNEKVDALEFAVYAEDDFRIGDRLSINAGVHFSGFGVDGEWYTSVQPRLGMRYLLPGDVALKGSFVTMQQYIHLLSNEGIGLPTDLWVPTTRRIRPQDAWQAAAGFAKTLGGRYEVSIEGFYKSMRNLISYEEGSSLFQFENWEDEVTQGDGESYGLEFFLQKKKGRLSGWIGYTLSWSYREFDDLNQGRRFPFKYDRRHDISVAMTYALSDRINLSAAWVYGTGNAVTLGESRYWAELPTNRFFTATHYTGRNNFRMRAYHRLDVNIDFIKERPNWKRTWSLGFYNAYSRRNPFFLYVDNVTVIDQNGERETQPQLKQVSLFPIIPAIAYKFEF